jgi:hypothetical protein
MTKITQEQLIESLKQLKDIKPRQEWASLLKSQILASPAEALAKEGQITAQKASFMNTFSSAFSPRKIAYSFAAFLFLIVGLFSFSRFAVPGDTLFSTKKVAEQSQAALTGQTAVNQDVVALNNRINDLIQVAKEGKTGNIPSAINEINANASALTKNLKSNTVNDPQTIKSIASSLKVLADVPGTDLTASQDMKDLYQTVVESQITDLQKATLTDDQKIALTQVEDLYGQGKYAEALEKILLINN